MCRAALIVNLSNANNKPLANHNLYGIVMNYVVNSYNKYNKDGYYIKFGNYQIRTLKFFDFISYIREHKNEINTSNSIQIHLRYATHGKGEDFVHGWRFLIDNKAFNCYHNGVIQLINKEHINDSYDLFKTVIDKTNENLNIVENIKTELNQRTGNGTFFIVGSNQSYIFAKNHGINVHLINDNVLIFNSNDDIHNLKKNVFIKNKKKLQCYGFEFEQEKEIRIETDLAINSDSKLQYDNCILVINEKGLEKIEMIEAIYNHPKSIFDYNNKNRGELEW